MQQFRLLRTALNDALTTQVPFIGFVQAVVDTVAQLIRLDALQSGFAGIFYRAIAYPAGILTFDCKEDNSSDGQIHDGLALKMDILTAVGFI